MDSYCPRTNEWAISEGLSIVTEPTRIPSVARLRPRKVKVYDWSTETRSETAEEFFARVIATGEDPGCYARRVRRAELEGSARGVDWDWVQDGLGIMTRKPARFSHG